MMDYEAPQLEEGQSVELYLKFNGVGAANQFGLSYTVKVTDNATLSYTGGSNKNDIFKLSAKSGQSGRNNEIGFTITVKDGLSTYYVYTVGSLNSAASNIDFKTNKISIFKRISGNICISNNSIYQGNSFNLTGWDNNATFNFNDLVWKISGGTMEGNKIVSAPYSGFILTVSAKQKYNGAEIAYSLEVPYHSISYYNDYTFIKRIYVKQGSKLNLEGRICSKTDFYQVGWSTQIGGYNDYALNSEYNGNSDLKLYAKWTTLRKEIKLTNQDKEINANNDYSYSEVISPLLDISTLRSLGYT
ncbi:MAG: hypothetical protein K2G96_06105, partial [Clostridia bacterium]|nr:hypothetical protein [Clostridia bacterium]